MSRNSKNKRDAKRKKQPKTGMRSRLQAPIQAHGEMKNGEGNVLLSIGKQGDDWVVVMDGQVVGGASNAADVMVMLHQFSHEQEREGHTILNTYSTTFQQAATEDAKAEGFTLDEYLARERQDPEVEALKLDDEEAASGANE